MFVKNAAAASSWLLRLSPKSVTIIFLMGSNRCCHTNMKNKHMPVHELHAAVLALSLATPPHG